MKWKDAPHWALNELALNQRDRNPSRDHWEGEYYLSRSATPESLHKPCSYCHHQLIEFKRFQWEFSPSFIIPPSPFVHPLFYKLECLHFWREGIHIFPSKKLPFVSGKIYLRYRGISWVWCQRLSGYMANAVDQSWKDFISHWCQGSWSSLLRLHTKR